MTPAGPVGRTVRLARSRSALAARHRGNGVDRDVVLLRPPRPVAPPAEGPGRPGGRGRRGALGGARRRLLPGAEVRRRPAAAARSRRVVQVGGVHDVALRLRADARPLLLRGLERPREARRRPRALARGHDLASGCSSSHGSSTTSSTGSSPTRACCGPCSSFSSRSRRGGRRELFSPRAAWLQVGAMIGTVMAANVFFVIIPAHWELIRAKEAGREPGSTAGHPGEAALGPQQLPHAAGAPDDARRALPVRLRSGPRVARARRPHGDRRLGAALLQPPPHGRTHWWMAVAAAAAFVAIAVVVERGRRDHGGARRRRRRSRSARASSPRPGAAAATRSRTRRRAARSARASTPPSPRRRSSRSV